MTSRAPSENDGGWMVVSKNKRKDDIEQVFEEDDALDDSDEDVSSDSYDSDVSQKSHGTRKNNRRLRWWFESLDGLSTEKINEPGRQWHCPACHGKPGGIRWFHLHPLLAHSRTTHRVRVKLHREFAKVLEKDLQIRGVVS